MKYLTATAANRPVADAAMAVADAARFFAAWVRNPEGVAAVAPSGRALASLITGGIDADTGPVLELGPGTGVFTEALIDRGVRVEDLTLVEFEGQFARLLRCRFPSARVVRMDAADLAGTTPVGRAGFGAVVCGLGLRNMTEGKIEAILRGAFSRMRPDAAFFLFTYGRRCSVPDPVLARLGLTATRVGTTIRNIPPASVYRVARSTIGGR